MESEIKADQDRISRRDLLRTSAALAPAAIAAAAQPGSVPNKRPNLVLIIADQVRWDAIGAYGRNPMNLTPNLDAMARRGTLYRNMFTNQPVCSPSRSALFTGQIPREAASGGMRETELVSRPARSRLRPSAGRLAIRPTTSGSGIWPMAPPDRYRQIAEAAS